MTHTRLVDIFGAGRETKQDARRPARAASIYVTKRLSNPLSTGSRALTTRNFQLQQVSHFYFVMFLDF